MAVVDAQAAYVVRARIGLVGPSVITVLEEGVTVVVPRAVPMHALRVPIVVSATRSTVAARGRHEVDFFRRGAYREPHSVLDCCVANNAWGGPVRDMAFAADLFGRVG